MQGAKTVVVDTNVLLLHGRHQLDILGELQKNGFTIILLDKVLAELTKLAVGQSKTAVAARLSLSLLKQKGLKTTLSSDDYADSAIVAYCRANHAAAATLDAALRRELRSAGIPLVTIHRSGQISEETDVLQAKSPRPHSSTTRSVR